MRTNRFLLTTAVILLSIAISLTACNLPSNDAEPTQGLNPTDSYQTAVARVTEFHEATQAALAGEPTSTPAPTESGETEAAATDEVTQTPSPTQATKTSTPEPCDKAAAGNPVDVTIPDNTKMVPGQEFVKTWRLVNVGTCTWTENYAVVWVSGAPLGNEDFYFLSSNVAPGQSADISVPMTAPEGRDVYQSNWQLRNEGGVLFGIGDAGDRVFWARIEVVAPTATPTATPTASPTATATAEVVVSGEVTLALNEQLDLDTMAKGAGDISYSVDSGGNHLVAPINGAQIGVFGVSQPGYGTCLVASLSTAAVAIESVGEGAFLCYRTDGGRYGTLQLKTYNSSTEELTVVGITWKIP